MDTRTWLQWGLWERAQRDAPAARECFLRGINASPVNSFCWQSLALLEAAAARPAEVHPICRGLEGVQRGSRGSLEGVERGYSGAGWRVSREPRSPALWLPNGETRGDGTVGCDWSRWVAVGSDWFRLVPMGRDWSRLVVMGHRRHAGAGRVPKGHGEVRG
eukprot:9183387-Pyramimonas_sp.AAC.1